MRYELFLAMRYLGALRRSQPFLSLIAGISICGVAVGVAALLVVLGVMSGFDADLEEKISGSNPHLVIEQEGGIAYPEDVLKKLSGISCVKAAAPFVQTEVILRHGTQATGVLLRGVDPARELQVTQMARSALQEGHWPPRPGEILVGSELARRWNLSPGETLTIVFGGKKTSSRDVRYTGSFTTGMYDYDLHLTVAPMEMVQELLGSSSVSGIGVRLSDPLQAPRAKQIVQQELGYPYWVVSWMDLNRNLFAALKLEKVAMFVILALIVLVACFNIVATLLMMVVKKTREIGILKAIGATPASIRRIFTWVGLLIGGAGTALGSAGGLFLCGLLKRYQFIQLPPEIYYIDRLPVRLGWADASAVIAAAFILSWCACLYPAWVAARLAPAEAIRYE